ncbi:class I SAM-dependent methyltransferase [Dactylosporangium sp. NPDC005555]|uniref:class I SAM-dependent methyltransferase n=1 Tax=Dactylosporangium sp. NPDC005555 TaxID=3154889 RepID=UPI0033AFBEAB
MDFAAHAASFGAAADLYDRIRPRYPRAALEWAIPEKSEICDLGAGTGILTRQLLDLGHTVTAVEPDAKMRAKIPGEAREGDAAHIPLEDQTVDVVTAGQAYHWFYGEPAHEEIARVLKSNGRFVPIWNIRDERVPWVAECSTLFDGARERDAFDETKVDTFGPLFGEVERKTFEWSTTHTAESFLELVKSRSYYLVADPEARQKLEGRLEKLLPRTETFELPYVTYAYIGRRR